jgi:hypothetical protein
MEMLKSSKRMLCMPAVEATDACGVALDKYIAKDVSVPGQPMPWPSTRALAPIGDAEIMMTRMMNPHRLRDVLYVVLMH